MRKILGFIILIFTLILSACTGIDKSDFNFDFIEEEITIVIGSVDELTLALDNMTTNDIELVVKDPEIVSVTGMFVTANQIGETTITATSSLLPGVSRVITVKVTQIQPLFNLNNNILEVGDELNIRLTNFDYRDFNWTVDKPEVGSLDANIKFKALSNGIVTITATSKTDSTIKNSIAIDVIEKKPVIYATTYTFQIGDKVTMYLDGFNNYTRNDYNWTVTDSTILQINNDFTVTGLKNGIASVTATLKTDLRVSSTYQLTVGVPSTSLNDKNEPNGGPLVITGFDHSTTIQAGETLAFEIAGANEFTNYRWTSSDNSIVQVTDQGIIYGAKAGRAIVTVALKDKLTVRGEIVVNVVGEPKVNYRKRIVDAAISEIGYRAGANKANKFGDWYNYDNADWCATFVTWAANQAGISTDIIPRFRESQKGWDWFEENATAHLKNSDYVPQAGDIIFFKDVGAGGLTHVGIVVKSYLDAERPYIYTVEGNVSSSVLYRTRYIDINYIYGYAVPNYPEYTK